MDAEREQIIKPVLIGSAARIRAVADKAGLDLGGCTIVDVPTEAEAAAAVGMVRGGKMQSIMKGSLHTPRSAARGTGPHWRPTPPAGTGTAHIDPFRGLNPRRQLPSTASTRILRHNSQTSCC